MVFAVTDSYCDEDASMGVSADRFDLVEEGKVEDFSNDDGDKHDENDCNDDGDGDKTSCNVLVVDFDS